MLFKFSSLKCTSVEKESFLKYIVVKIAKNFIATLERLTEQAFSAISVHLTNCSKKLNFMLEQKLVTP